jgi:cardiolipin synthase (CMP-forming)
MNIPTLLTWARIGLIPVLLIVLYLPGWLASQASAQAFAAGIFVLCAVTDWLDGHLARVLRQQTAFGAFLDPVADKLLVCSVLVALVHLGRIHAFAAIVIIGREVAVSALREWMAAAGRSASVSVAAIGKWKTTIQLAAIPFLLIDAQLATGLRTVDIGGPLLWCAVVLTVASMVHYLLASRAPRRPATSGPFARGS